MSDSTFTIHRHEVSVKYNGKPIYIIPFGDVHRFAPLCHTEKWLEFLEWAKSKCEESQVLFLGMGDYDDLLSTSERHAISVSKLHESTLESLEDLMVERTHKLCDELSFMRGNIIGILEGNHYGSLQSGITTTQLMCQQLKARYLGVSSFIRVTVKDGTSTGRMNAVDIWAHHGRGASRLAGSSINSVAQMSGYADADIYLMGHDHKKSVAMMSKLQLEGRGADLKLRNKKMLFGRTGSFLRGYVDGKDSYVAKAAMCPTDLGVIKIELTPTRKKANGVDDYFVDIHASI